MSSLRDSRREVRGRPTPVATGSDSSHGNMGTSVDDTSRGESSETLSPNKRLVDRIRSRGKGGLSDVDKALENRRKAKRKEALRLKNSGTKGNDEGKGSDEELVDEQDKFRDTDVKDTTYVSIVQTQQAMHIFPINILHSSRFRENTTQPLLYTPYGHPHFVEHDKLLPVLWTCLLPGASTLPREPKRREGTWEIENFGHMHSHSLHSGDANRDLEESAHLLDSPKRPRRRGVNTAEGVEMTSRGDADSSSSEAGFMDGQALFSAELKSPIRREEGLYPGHDSSIVPMLLASEPVDLPLAKLVASNIYLSRATQRQLRELISYYYSDYLLNRMWKNLTTHREVSEQVELFKRGINSKDEIEWHQMLKSQERGDGRLPGLSLLLKFNESEPTLRVMENFVNETVMQQTHPATSKKILLTDDAINMPLKDKNQHLASSIHSSSATTKNGVTLKILAQEVALTNHPYMCEEEYLFVELKTRFMEYSRLIQSKAHEYLPYRLLSSMSEIEHLVDPHVTDQSPEDTQVTLHQLYNDALETSIALSEFKNSLDKASNAVYSLWREIQKLRKKQGFISTRASLVGRRVRRDDGGGQNHWKQLHIRLHQLPKLMDLAYGQSHAPESQPSKLSSSNLRSSSITRQNSVAAKPIDGFDKLQNSHKEALKIIEAIVEHLTGMDDSSLLPDVVFTVTNTGTCTVDTQLPGSELERRRKLRRVKVRVLLKVNGQVLASSTPQLLQWPSLKVDIGRMFEMRVLHEPSEAVFEVYASYELKNTFLSCVSDFLSHETLVATVGVPLAQRLTQHSKRSGDNLLPAVCYVPVMGWYQFASHRLITASRGRGLTLLDNNKKSQISAIRFEGALLCGSEYDVAFDRHDKSVVIASSGEGVLGQDLAFIPSQWNSEWKSDTHGRIVGGALEFTEEKDFFEMLPSLNMLDINDPRNDGVVQKKLSGILSGRMKKRDIFQLGGEFVARLHAENGVSYGHFIKFKASDRIRLLRLREQKPYLFTERIPLSETVIRNSVLFRNMLLREDRPLHVGDAQPSLGLLEDLPTTENLPDGDAVAHEGAALGATRRKAVDFLARVRDSQTVMSRKSRKKKVVTSSVVYERMEPLNEFSFFQLLKVVSFPQRKRALKPSPVERVPEALPKRCELLVQIVSARNVPLRIGGQDEDLKTSTSRNRRSGGFGGNDDYGYESSTLLGQERDSQFLKEKKRVSTFVEVEFQGKKVRTTSMDGPAPSWKQSMTLPFMPPHGEFNHSNLEQVDDIVHFSLFDEIIHDDAARGGFLDGENTMREERRFLGSFSLPFSTILSERRIEGTFRLNTPPINYGYKPTSTAAAPQDVQHAPPSGGIMGLLGFTTAAPQRRLEEPKYIDEVLEKELEWCCCSDRTCTFITIMATLDPLLTSSPYLDSDLSVATAYGPDRPLIPRALMWLSNLQGIGQHTKKRKYTVFGSNSDGLSVLVCRFLKPLQPPPGITTRRACIHVVSLIPFIPDSQAFVGEFDLWCTTKQTLEIMAGDEEEHATTLYNYLYYLSLRDKNGAAAAISGNGDSKDRPFEGYPTHSFVAQEELFLVSGYAVPEGKTTYVLIRKEGRTGQNSSAKGTRADAFLLVNPCTGYVYSAADPKCPIKDIYSLATPYNVWANIQKATSPKDLSFDIMNPSLWQPLFNRKFKPGITSISSIQPDIAYSPTPTAPCLEIEKLLKNEIISSFRKWRAKRARPDTAFHPEACLVMTDMLEWLEEWKMHGTLDGQVMAGGEKRSNSSLRSQSIPNEVLMSIEDKAAHRLKNVTRTSNLTGYPVNMSYTDVDSIITAVRSYCVHETRHPQVQFVLAVRVFPLFNGLMSLWIFLGTLERERS